MQIRMVEQTLSVLGLVCAGVMTGACRCDGAEVDNQRAAAPSTQSPNPVQMTLEHCGYWIVESGAWADECEKARSAFLLENVPQRWDAWGKPLQFECDDSLGWGVRSAGWDGIYSNADDIVLYRGEVRIPQETATFATGTHWVLRIEASAHECDKAHDLFSKLETEDCLDGWGREFRLECKRWLGWGLRSAGRDGRFYTDDDMAYYRKQVKGER